MTTKHISYVLVPATALVLLGSLLLLTPLSSTKASNGDYAVTIQNISNAILTPPVVAYSNKNNAKFFEVGESASEALEKLAEGGATDDLQSFFSDKDASVAAHNAPLLPGESVTLNVSGKNRGHFYLASMILPTNDGFVAINGTKVKVRGDREVVLFGSSYDAGTESNSELNADIPGPFGGEGFNSARDDVNFVYPHAGLHGEGDQSAEEFNWGNPTVKVTIERI